MPPDSRWSAAPLRRADTVDAYLARPIGSCLLGPTYAVWWRSPKLNGIMFWDRPEEDHVLRITRALDAELAPDTKPHASLIDARRMRAVDLGAFNALSQYVDRRSEPFSRIVTRQALLRPTGLAGAAVAGFYAVIAARYPVGVFTDPGEALCWLGVEQESRIADELDGLYAEATASSSVVVALRAHLDDRWGATTLSEAAGTLGMSTRQLQRKLRDARTRFQDEEMAAKIRAAKMLLLETNYDIKRVALEVGCASLQHFGALFRRVTGETPSHWRARVRPEAVAPPRSAQRTEGERSLARFRT